MKAVDKVTKDMSAKSIRMSVVALSATASTVIWLLLDELTGIYISAPLVSASTGLVLLVAQFYDHKAKAGGHEVFEGEPE